MICPRLRLRSCSRRGRTSQLSSVLAMPRGRGCAENHHGSFASTQHLQWSPVMPDRPPARYPLLSPFLSAPTESCVMLSHHTALRCSHSIFRLSGRVFCVYRPMTIPTYPEGFAPHCGHYLKPERFFLPSLSIEITQLTNMVYCYLFLASTEFAGVL